MVENTALKQVFDLKRQQLGSDTSRTMLQLIPAQFCDMVGRIGFHAEYAPLDGMIILLQIAFDNANRFLTPGKFSFSRALK